ncbi:MAG: hypothetical protein GF403_08565 [Candidatus Coatesbacteria bacterium]|nr:hypothetical protein [Candidatus Coatesbacteria bacterium]
MSDKEKAEARRKLSKGEALSPREVSYLYGLSATLPLEPEQLAAFKRRVAELSGKRRPTAGSSKTHPVRTVKPSPPLRLAPSPAEGFDTCLTCGYADGFHLAPAPGVGNRVLLICPECGQRYDLGMSIGRSTSFDD